MPSNVKDPHFDAVRFNLMLRPIADVEELQKKKQSDVLRFLLRVRCWEVRQPINPKSTIQTLHTAGNSVVAHDVSCYTLVERC